MKKREVRIPFPVFASIEKRCSIFAKVESALRGESGVRMIACSNSRPGYSGFLIIPPGVVRAMDARPRDSLMQSKLVVQRILGSMKLELLKDARQRGEEDVFFRYWPQDRMPRETGSSVRCPYCAKMVLEEKLKTHLRGSCRNAPKSVPIKVEELKQRLRTPPQHSTFDDCSSVWTAPSNWKRDDEKATNRNK
jgi:hypothetical protein